MDLQRKQQVSMRGASVREISRDALLEQVTKERELRSYNRRVAASALFIQRVWRRYNMAKKVAMKLRREWDIQVSEDAEVLNCTWVSNTLLRPFLFFITYSSTLYQKPQVTDDKCMLKCFKILLKSINLADPEKNFCALALGTPEEKSAWLYQSCKLFSICSYVLSKCNYSSGFKDTVLLTAICMRLMIALTDIKTWKNIKTASASDGAIATRSLIITISNRSSGLYCCMRSYIMKLPVSADKQYKIVQIDDLVMVTASAITLAVRPFQVAGPQIDEKLLLHQLNTNQKFFQDIKDAAEQFCIFLLTIPWFKERIPGALLPALRHPTVLFPCLKVLLISKDEIFSEMANLDKIKESNVGPVPSAAWALGNIMSLVTEHDSECTDSGRFLECLDYKLYLHAVCCISEFLLPCLEMVRDTKKYNDKETTADDISKEATQSNFLKKEEYSEDLSMSLVNLIKPVQQQWHLIRLLAVVKKNDMTIGESHSSVQSSCLELLDIVFFYSHMLRIYSLLNLASGSLPVLNVLAFTPGFLLELWEGLEGSLMSQGSTMSSSTEQKDISHVSLQKGALEEKERRSVKDSGNKWVNVLQKFTGKSTLDTDIHSSDRGSLFSETFGTTDQHSVDNWDVESLRRGPQGISKGASCMLYLFCTTYAHLLLVLDDTEFYEKQVPFSLEQQRKISAMLNTAVYNGFIYNGQYDKILMDSAVRCLHLLYERDCRHRFCPPSLWTAPASKNRPPVAAAARAHEALSNALRSGDALTSQSMGSVINTIPHVFPFEERVQMFREFIKSDKESRRMAGEIAGPGPGSVEIAIRRDHIIEDGFRQLNSLGSKLKSCINVSFVNEYGLPEAGLDYGGLFKEFLTDIAKAAFNPDYGLFSQTSTSERLLIPHPVAGLLDKNIHMIEFLGRLVGKALYEGILLDYSFSLVFVQKLLGRYSFIDELSGLDPELYRNLMYVKHYDGDVKDLSLDFTVTEESLGKRVVTELKPGGANLIVTNENKLQYVHAIADYKLNRQVFPLANAFYRGLVDLILPSWLRLFNASEFNQLLSGGEHDFDIDDLKNNTRYTGGYSEGSRTIKLFWEVVRGFEPKERCMLLKFVTSCSRAPLLGFKHLQPSFTIHKVACDVPLWAVIGGQDVDRLPSASTCYNTLKLPTYKRQNTLRNKLLYAISSNAGFELS
ncbi:E3 ubiquitin-protein ligase UPL7 isoform X2 [Nymphaea colorata]|uniref:E3 ubiquitin-protein ligase UPL7 isoform X2 n=1 Tax=Nymphaea colorata TaxID=210225 RepID=UPI00129D95A9|nr:E3 ubiquitin-protein ligase UPL7 isoform X2 [Nymphaea colorata]